MRERETGTTLTPGGVPGFFPLPITVHRSLFLATGRHGPSQTTVRRLRRATQPRGFSDRPERGRARRTFSSWPQRFGVDFLRLQFTDILGVNKNVEIPPSQFEKALAGDIMFDGSSIEGFVRIEESDMLLAPDLDTFRILP